MVNWRDFLSFADGVLDIYRVYNCAEAGDQPREKLRHKYHLRYSAHVVGINRFYEAKQAQVEITRAVDVPMRSDVNPQDVVIIDGKQYRIEQKQEKLHTLPASMTLSLSDITEVYEIDVQ